MTHAVTKVTVTEPVVVRETVATVRVVQAPATVRVVAPSPPIVTRVATERTVLVNTGVGAQGAQGATGATGGTGPSGATGAMGPGNVFVQASIPSPDPSVTQYLWIQTNMGASGEDITFWIEDGD